MENLIKANYRKGKMIKKGTENLTKKINKLGIKITKKSNKKSIKISILDIKLIKT